MDRMPGSFFQQSSVELARALLGCRLVHDSKAGRTSGLIVETEAYCGPADKAAHSYGNRRTKRTEAMFGPAGHAYIYLIYGMYRCFNVVAATTGEPQAVLVRALEPCEGLDLMAKRRGLESGAGAIRKLCSGPGKLTQAMGITEEHYGIDLRGDVLFLQEGEPVAPGDVGATPRINVDYAKEWRDKPWRFVIKDSRFLSRPWR